MTEKPSRSDARLLQWAYFSLQRRRSPRSKSRVCVIPGYVVSSWEDSLISGSFSGYKRSRDIVGLNQTELQEGNVKNNQVSGLTHQFSLPKTSSEIAAIEKFLQFQDSVPCKIRAKRGCATRPRNIAERVRRTRISERIILTVIDIVIDYYCLPVLAAE